MLVQSRLGFLLVLENVVETSRQLRPSLSVEDHLTGTNVGRTNSLLVHYAERLQYFVCDVTQNRLWHCAYAIYQVG